MGGSGEGGARHSDGSRGDEDGGRDVVRERRGDRQGAGRQWVRADRGDGERRGAQRGGGDGSRGEGSRGAEEDMGGKGERERGDGEDGARGQGMGAVRRFE